MLMPHELLLAFNDHKNMAKKGRASELSLLLRKYDYGQMAHQFAEELRRDERDRAKNDTLSRSCPTERMD